MLEAQVYPHTQNMSHLFLERDTAIQKEKLKGGVDNLLDHVNLTNALLQLKVLRDISQTVMNGATKLQEIRDDKWEIY